MYIYLTPLHEYFILAVGSRNFYLKWLAHKMFSIPLSIFSLLYVSREWIFRSDFHMQFYCKCDKCLIRLWKKTDFHFRLFVYSIYRIILAKAHMLLFKILIILTKSNPTYVICMPCYWTKRLQAKHSIVYHEHFFILALQPDLRQNSRICTF